MYKAIIIDDEMPARRAIRALGEWEQNFIEIAAEADNGLQGMDLLLEHEPDIVFVDMKMPLMGGQAFLEHARSALPDACYIVISGFDDFEYARSAMLAGSIDYLLKPIRKTELNDVIIRAIELIDKRRERNLSERKSQIYRNLSAPLVKEKIYSSIIDGNGRFHHIHELEAVLDADAGQAVCRVVVFKLLNAAESVERKFVGDPHAFYYALANAADELLSRFGRTFSFKNNRDDQEIVSVVNVSDGQADTSLDLSDVTDKLEALFGVRLTAALGHAAGMESLGESYASASRALMALNMIGLKPVPPNKESELERPSVLDRTELFAQAIESGSERHAVQSLRKWLEEIEASGVVTMSVMLAIEAELRLLAESLLSEFKTDDIAEEPWLEQFDAVLRRRVYEFYDFKEAVLTYFVPLLEALAEAGKSKVSTAEKIKAYIDVHYYEELPVSFFSERYHTSKEHLTRVFKQRYGLGIHEYMLQVRMAKAKEWLREKSLRIQVVCEKVGFRDQNYFSKAFKKYTGLTPQEYRAGLDE